MHIAICTIGWIYSPEATKEITGMTFKKNIGVVKYVIGSVYEFYPVIRD